MLRRLADQFEISSSAHVAANGIERDADWFLLKLQEEMGELTQHRTG
jgi:NTP pyrophosphatase (non-canonical NTP hydrolase)